VSDPRLRRRDTGKPDTGQLGIDAASERSVLDGGPEARAGESANVEAELRAVASLLRSLPDPEPPADLTDRVIERVAAQQSRTGIVRGAFRHLGQPRTVAALAAGISCLVLVTAVQNGSIGRLGPAANEVATSRQSALASGRHPALLTGRPAAWVSRAGAAAPLAFFAPDSHQAHPSLAPTYSVPPLDRRLDRQLDKLLLDPNAFLQHLERVFERDRFVSRLANRAARRGDSVDVALRVRSASHPLASELVEEFLRASLVESVSRR